MHLKHIKRKISLLVLSMTVLAITPLGAQRLVDTGKPFTIPEVDQWTALKGTCALEGITRICTDGSEEAGHVAGLLAEDYGLFFNRSLELAGGKAKAGAIYLDMVRDAKLGDEGYRLEVKADQIVLSATTERGLYWATRTLLQLCEMADGKELACGKVMDKPEYAIRGFMLDCGRKFIPMSYLRKIVRVLAYYKMNTLQVHLNDNGFKQFFDHDWNRVYGAFRLECETYPGLTAPDGYYTKEEFRAFQKEAAALGVEVIPEIDVPAHSLAFAHYKPEIGSKEYGMDHLDLANPETYEFLDALFKEYLEGEDPVFVGKRVNIGTDEYSNAKQEVVEQFRKFTDHYLRLVESYGKQAVCWGALTHARGETPVKSENVIMNWWYNGYAKPDSMAMLGYRGISMPDGWLYIVPAAGYYNDNLNTEWLYNNWTPNMVGNVTFEKGDPAVLGAQFAVWNDHVGNGISVKDIHHRAMPALQTLAEKMWHGDKAALPFEQFDALRLELSEAPGVNELARYGESYSTVVDVETLQPGMSLEIPEIGYDYTVTFVIDGAKEQPGTELFRSESAVFYLSDPVSGLMGYQRDGYLYTFRYAPYPGRRDTLTIEGDARGTRFYVNGRLRDDLSPRKLYFDGGKASINYMSTLVFPLGTAGEFQSRISQFKVENFIKK